MAKTSPTQRTLHLLRKEGYTAQVVEKFVAWANRRIDLFGFIDVVGIHPDKQGILGVQTTSGSNLSARIKKSQALAAYHIWLRAGNTIEFHGWRKLKNLPGNRQWDCDRRIVTPENPLVVTKGSEKIISNKKSVLK